MTGSENNRLYDYIEHITQAIERIRVYVDGPANPHFRHAQ